PAVFATSLVGNPLDDSLCLSLCTVVWGLYVSARRAVGRRLLGDPGKRRCVRGRSQAASRHPTNIKVPWSGAGSVLRSQALRSLRLANRPSAGRADPACPWLLSCSSDFDASLLQEGRSRASRDSGRGGGAAAG